MLWLAIIGAVWLAVWAVLHLREQSSWEAGAVDQTRVAPDVLAGGVLFWLILGFFWRTVSGDVYQPADGGDLVSFLFPTYRFAAQQLSQGVLPLWNPHLYGGAPFISERTPKLASAMARTCIVSPRDATGSFPLSQTLE